MASEFWMDEGSKWRDVGMEQGGEDCLTKENGCFGCNESRGEEEGQYIPPPTIFGYINLPNQVAVLFYAQNARIM